MNWIAILFIALSNILTFGNSRIINSAIQPDNIYIGDPVSLSIEVSIPKDATIAFPYTEGQELEGFIIKKIDRISKIEGAEQKLKYNIIMTTLDKEIKKTPDIALPVSVSGKVEEIKISGKKISVLSLLSKDSKDIRPLKPTLRLPFPWFIFSIIAIAIIIGLFLLVRMLIGRAETAKDRVIETPLNPDEWVLSRIKELMERNLIVHKMYKEHYIILVDVLKAYLTYKTSLPFIDMTTEECISALQTAPLKRDTVMPLRAIMNVADAVKFAKYIPENEENHSISLDVKSFLELCIQRKEPEDVKAS